MTPSGYPNVHARLQLTQHAPDNPPRSNAIEVWLKDTRFRVRELSGRRLDEILADVTAPRQLGALPRSIEDMMDRDAARAGQAAPTELYGDLATDEGWVYRPGREPAPMRASKLAPVAEQILARDRAAGLQAAATVTRLGRTATEYRGVVTVTEDGEQFHNAVSRAIAPPYLLVEHARSEANAELAYHREIVALDEGSVSDADVTPPP